MTNATVKDEARRLVERLPEDATPRMQESPYNVMCPNGISRGRFYERHFLADSFFSGTRFPRGIGGTWSGTQSGLQRPGLLARQLFGMPDQTQGVMNASIRLVWNRE